MKGNATVISNLFTSASLEATAKAQYHINAESLGSADYSYAANLFDCFKKDEKCFLKKLIKRLVYFEQNPSYSTEKVEGPDSVTSAYEGALKIETGIVDQYQGFCKQAWDVLDDNTRNIYEHLIKWHEDNIFKLERELALIAELGEEAYCAARLRDDK